MQLPKATYLGDKNNQSIIAIPKVYKVNGIKTIRGNLSLSIKLLKDNETTINFLIEAINEKLERDFTNAPT